MSTTTSFMRLVGNVNAGITALAGGAQPSPTTNATAVLTGAVNTVTVVATDNDSVLIPADRTKFDTALVFNLDAGQDIKIYPPSGGTINGAAANAALVVGQQQGSLLVCVSDDGLTWMALLTSVATPA